MSAAVRIEYETPARGDIGQCEGDECDRRAGFVIVFNLQGITAHTWLCDAHRRVLLALVAKAA